MRLVAVWQWHVRHLLVRHLRGWQIDPALRCSRPKTVAYALVTFSANARFAKMTVEAQCVLYALWALAISALFWASSRESSKIGRRTLCSPGGGGSWCGPVSSHQQHTCPRHSNAQAAGLAAYRALQRGAGHKRLLRSARRSRPCCSATALAGIRRVVQLVAGSTAQHCLIDFISTSASQHRVSPQGLQPTARRNAAVQ